MAVSGKNELARSVSGGWRSWIDDSWYDDR